MKSLDEFIKYALNKPRKKIAVACPEDVQVLEALKASDQLNLANFILFGNEEKIFSLAKTIDNFNLNKFKIVNTKDAESSCFEAVKCVSTGNADVLMKGLVDTSVILKKVLDKDYGLRTESILSHVMILELPKFGRLIFLSDGAMNIDPDVNQLKLITTNVVGLARDLHISRPKVALLSAIEKVNPKMPSSVKAREIELMAERGEIVHCDVCGPLAVDLALDKEAAKIKQIRNPVAGNADILIAPYIEVANALYKGLVFGCDNVKSAGIIVGARVPIVLTSRADSHETKLYSIALSVLMN